MAKKVKKSNARSLAAKRRWAKYRKETAGVRHSKRPGRPPKEDFGKLFHELGKKLAEVYGDFRKAREAYYKK